MRKAVFSYSEADESDFHRIACFLNREQFGLRREEWIRWKYHGNPLGRGRIFLAENDEEQIVGMLGFVPHVMYEANGEALPVMGVVDGFISSEGKGKNLYRGLLELGMVRVGMPLLAFHSL